MYFFILSNFLWLGFVVNLYFSPLALAFWNSVLRIFMLLATSDFAFFILVSVIDARIKYDDMAFLSVQLQLPVPSEVMCLHRLCQAYELAFYSDIFVISLTNELSLAQSQFVLSSCRLLAALFQRAFSLAVRPSLLLELSYMTEIVRGFYLSHFRNLFLLALF